ncbi:hypothetical protein DNTS_035015 [Danionella cerebrum]|uniref:SMP-LTD domain-containing protein n=1 Tax=Danionella cerebrum TaxID=2873325 RepID=A0A553R3D6_9TELE|nr:hypothetical protein DNTS_035015 [Danionella translucida]
MLSGILMIWLNSIVTLIDTEPVVLPLLLDIFLMPVIFCAGWMNEISCYDPETYHATLTHSVYVRLEGSVLRLSKPNRNIPRRAAFSELKPDVSYISQKIYDLTNSKVYLVPYNLARKRVWNKKYPICIELAKQDDFLAKAEDEKSEAAANDSEGTSEDSKRAHADPVLFLFGRTGRDKEECRSSSRGSLDEALQSQPRQRDLGASVKQKVLEYNVYMAKYVGQSPGSPATSPVQSTGSSPATAKKFPDSGEPSVESETWVNSLLGRMFWDFLREKYWADVVSKKIQKKLSKIRLPYFMNELTLTELDMGLSIPRILSSSKPSVDHRGKKTLSLFVCSSRGTASQSEQSDAESDLSLASSLQESEQLCSFNQCGPTLRGISSEGIEHRGLWFDLEISYNGSFLMTLQTKMNLSRLGKEVEGIGEQGKEGCCVSMAQFSLLSPLSPLDSSFVDVISSWSVQTLHKALHCILGSRQETQVLLGDVQGFDHISECSHEVCLLRPRTYFLADSDEESSSAGSSDEDDAAEFPELLGVEGYVGGHRPSKIMRFVDKIAKSKYFQKATETEFIKKKMEEVSNTPLLLTVEVQECQGTLAVNIPPPPTDRIWYGFKRPPRLELKARPKLGEREVTFAHVTDWIEKKLDQEFQKIFVMPNMDDIWLPIMHAAMDTRSSANTSKGEETSDLKESLDDM